MIRFRLYFDKDEEQEWLNQMSDEGWAMESFFLGFYRFSSCQPGEFIYQIDLLDDWSGDSKDFAEFMDELKIKKVSQWWRWIFLRKKAADGPFEMYTDNESKIAQYARIRNFFKFAAVAEILLCSLELYGFATMGNIIFLLFAALLAFLALALSKMAIKCNRKIMRLRMGQDYKQPYGGQRPWLLCIGLLLNLINLLLQRFWPFPSGIYPDIILVAVAIISCFLMVLGTVRHIRQNRP